MAEQEMLNANNRRLCIIEKTESGREITAALAAKNSAPQRRRAR